MREIASRAFGPASLADCLTMAACSEAVAAASRIAGGGGGLRCSGCHANLHGKYCSYNFSDMQTDWTSAATGRATVPFGNFLLRAAIAPNLTHRGFPTFTCYLRL